MGVIGVLIVDDEPPGRERIRTLLGGAVDVRILGECANGREAVDAIRSLSPDLVFLDVQMPELDGFEVLESLDAARMPSVVFVTAYDEYALRAFEVHALDYLLKPFDRERFERALDRARSQLAGRRTAAADERLLALLEDLRAERSQVDRLAVRSGGRVFFVRPSEIDWIEAAANYVRLHVRGQAYALRESMKSLEGKLDPRLFLRIHRSAIVNIDRIKQLEPWFHGEYVVTLADGTKLQSSRSYSDRLHALVK